MSSGSFIALERADSNARTGQNLYVGTSAHEILHLVSIPPTPHPEAPAKPCYILASRLQPLAASTPANPFIKQILVLPTVSKALVLSSTGWLTFYTLPEFSPAYNGTKLKDVSYIGGLDLNEEEREGIPEEGSSEDRPKLVMCHAKNKIRLVRCLSEEIRLVKVFTRLGEAPRSSPKLTNTFRTYPFPPP